ncbi:MAG TPA: hypothetical protein VGK94_11905 [Candidatus Polarisedimenticolia bacterium]|jgi:hypothetical protein
MRIISVAAPGNGSGKTLALAAILGAYPGRIDAVKFTTVFKDGVNCPRTEKACACRSLHGRFTIVTDQAVLGEDETDTGRLTRAGARSVLWCLAQPDAHAEAWNHLRDDLLGGARVLLTEGNTVVPVLDPDLLIVVMSPQLARGRWKPDAWTLVERAHHVVINNHRSDPAALEALATEVAAVRNGRRPPVEDVSLPLRAWADRTLPESLRLLMETDLVERR